MPARKTFTVICYDVALTRRRTKIAALLEKHGTRQNKSVFECMLTATQLKKIQAELALLIDPKTDTILCYRVCLSCYTKSEIVGKRLAEIPVKKVKVV